MLVLRLLFLKLNIYFYQYLMRLFINIQLLYFFNPKFLISVCIIFFPQMSQIPL